MPAQLDLLARVRYRRYRRGRAVTLSGPDPASYADFVGECLSANADTIAGAISDRDFYDEEMHSLWACQRR